jgi:C4-type Zn-finger protein
MDNNTETNNTYYCPVCGNPMTVQGMQIDYTPGHAGESFPVLACKDNADCPLRGATVSLEGTQTDRFYDGWKVKRIYNPLTGQRIADHG